MGRKQLRAVILTLILPLLLCLTSCATQQPIGSKIQHTGSAKAIPVTELKKKSEGIPLKKKGDTIKNLRSEKAAVAKDAEKVETSSGKVEKKAGAADKLTDGNVDRNIDRPERLKVEKPKEAVVENPVQLAPNSKVEIGTSSADHSGAEYLSAPTLSNSATSKSTAAVTHTAEPVPTNLPASVKSTETEPTPVVPEPAKQLEKIQVNGSMDIQFNSRVASSDQLAKEGITDKYSVNLMVGSTPIKGEIVRKPAVKTFTGLGSMPLGYEYNLDLGGSKTQWLGGFSIGTDGKYSFDKGLRITGANGGIFSGEVQGKAEEKKGVVSTLLREYSRVFRGKKVTVTAKQVDPVRVGQLSLPAGPADFPSALVEGSFDYDYDTGNWFADSLNFKSKSDGVVHADKITGSIKWIEDSSRDSNGKGHYELNLRFNEEALRGAGNESEFFENKELDSEEAFFAVEDSIPGIFGTIDYSDTFAGEDKAVIRSKIAYRVFGRGVSKAQLMNFIKFWLLIVGPANDE